MMKPRPDASNAEWLEKFMSGTKPVETAAPTFRSQGSPAQQKADERTRLVREMTDAATEKRLAMTARLKAARLGKEAEDRAQAALEPPKAKRKPRRKT